MAGFRQLADSSNSFSGNVGLERAKQAVNGKFTAYPIKRKTHGIQLAPYFSDALSVRVEAHDGFHGIPRDKMPQLLWMTRQVKIGPVTTRTLDACGTFLILVANAYENSESAYASFDGELNLRDYIDLGLLFRNKGGDLSVESMLEIAKEFGLSEALAVVLSNYRDVFPDKGTPLDLRLRPSCSKVTCASFVDRVFDRAAENNRVFANLRSGINPLRAPGSTGLAVQEGAWTRFENEPRLPIDFRIDLDSDNVGIVWRFPEQLGTELPLLGFQVAFIPKKSREYLELLVGVVLIDGEPKPFCQKSQRLAQRFIVAPDASLTKVTYEETEDFVYLSVSAPYSLFSLEEEDCEAGMGVIPMVFVKSTSRDYRSINPWESDFTTIRSLKEDIHARKGVE